MLVRSMTTRISRADFEPLLGQDFQVQTPGQPVQDWTLVEVTGSPSGAEGFDLLFTGPLHSPVGQGVVRLTGPNLSPLDLFAVPLGPDGQGMQYQIIFN